MINAIDIIILLILAVIVGLAIRFIIKQKKKGACIGCPYAGNCKKENCNH